MKWLTLSFLCACGSSAPPAQALAPDAATGCSKDTDCKGARLCIRGSCEDPIVFEDAGARDLTPLGDADPPDDGGAADLTPLLDLVPSPDLALPRPPAGYIAYWSFDNDAKDSGPSHLDGSMIGRPTKVPGQVGGAYHFTGGSCIGARYDKAIDLAGKTAITLMAWVNIDACPGNGWYRFTILSKEGGYAHALNCVQANQDPLEYQSRLEVHPQEVYSPGGLKVFTGTWHFVAATYDGVTEQRYRDNAKDWPTPKQGPLAEYVAGQGIGIGCGQVAPDGKSGASTEPFNGAIDEVLIYDRVLSEKEIVDYYEATK